MSANKATLKSYLDQWSEYFEGLETEEELLTRLRNFAFDGHLRSCKFRSICWRIFLRCLPCQTDKWKEKLEKSRERYVEIKNKYVTKPSSETKAKDVAVDNPLSQSDQSSWNQFFKNTDLKKTIERDVKRTFPEMEYFHDEKVHKLLVDILFCYAQEHSDLLYRQGMHELLAPLVFIIHCDLQAACHGREIGSLTEHINLVLDKTYLEHDAYDMFCHLMESTNPWYSVTERGKREETEEGITENENGVETENSSIQTVPFQPQEIATSGGPTLAITNKLNHIHNTLLVQHDLQLHTHLNRLEIIPQVFGLRWIRLLFGREFSLQDLLVLWDATFADSSTLDLVDYLFVAMLINIRHLLLNADYSSCMQILMKYPPIDDINDIVQAAKDIRVLKGRSFSDSFKEITPAPSGNKTSKSERSLKSQSTPQGRINKQNSFTKIFKDLTRKVMPENKPNPPIPSHMKDPTYAGHIGSPPQMQSAVTGKWNTNGTPGPGYFKQIPPLTEAPRAEEILRKHPVQLERELILLHQEMDRMQQMCLFCSDKVSACVTVLQSSVSSTTQDDQSSSSAANETSESTSMENKSTEVEQEKFEKEQILVTVASLKQIRDLLNGTLTFNPNLQEYTGRRKHEAENGAVEIRAPQAVVNILTEAGDT